MKNIDERITTTRDKINSRAFSITLFGLWGIMMFRMFILHQTPGEYTDIFILTIVASAFSLIGNVKEGVFTRTVSTIKCKIASISIDILFITFFILVFSFLTGITSVGKLFIAGVTFTLIKYSPKLLSLLSNRALEKKIDKE